jgi:hypothetical protein
MGDAGVGWSLGFMILRYSTRTATQIFVYPFFKSFIIKN